MAPARTDPINCSNIVLTRIGVHVDWTAEKACFETFLRELAYFYVPGPTPFAGGQRSDDEQASETRSIQHVIFPAARQYLQPPTKLLKKDIVLATSLESLYKV